MVVEGDDYDNVCLGGQTGMPEDDERRVPPTGRGKERWRCRLMSPSLRLGNHFYVVSGRAAPPRSVDFPNHKHSYEPHIHIPAIYSSAACLDEFKMGYEFTSFDG